MTEKLNINDDVKVLKLNILKENLKQNWNLDTDIWNEEFPHDFRFEDTYLQLSFILRDFNIDELKHLIYITNLFDVRNYNHDISTLINNYVKSCVEYLNHEIDGKADEYFKKYNKNNNCFSYEKKIKEALSKHKIQYSLFFYGTLKASEVRRAVLGENIKYHETTNGFLTHYKVFQVKDANYPLIKFTNKFVKKMETNLNNFSYNIIIANLHEMQNFLSKEIGKGYSQKILKQNYEKILITMIPIIPHFSNECLEMINKNNKKVWPEYDEELTKEDLNLIVVQINGKKRGLIEAKQSMDEDALNKLIFADEKITKYLENKEIKKKIYIKDKLINIII